MLYNIYCDESRQSKDRFMVLGGVIIRNENLNRINDEMAKLRKEINFNAEIKWTKVTNQKLEEYKKIIDFIVYLLKENLLRFHSIIIDNSKIDNKTFNRGNKEIGFYKFYYQLIFHLFGKQYLDENSNTKYILYLDRRNTSYKLNTLKHTLNNGMKKKYGINWYPFCSISGSGFERF